MPPAVCSVGVEGPGPRGCFQLHGISGAWKNRCVRECGCQEGIVHVDACGACFLDSWRLPYNLMPVLAIKPSTLKHQL